MAVKMKDGLTRTRAIVQTKTISRLGNSNLLSDIPCR